MAPASRALRPASGGPPRLACAELRGGNHPVFEPVEMPGLQGIIYSHPCHGARGGDVHYLSVCGSGLLARVCVADVAGHGEALARVGSALHTRLRRGVDQPDERRVLRALDRQLSHDTEPVLTTAAVVSYYPPGRRLTVSYAGHPRGWLYRGGDRSWMRLDAEVGEVATPSGRLVDLPLATGLSPSFSRARIRVAPGDRVLLVTDGVLEAPAPDGREFGPDGVARVLEAHDGPLDALAGALLEALVGHAGRDDLTHDDVTFFVGEIVDGPPGPALWHVVRNRVLRRLGMSGGWGPGEG